MKTRIEFILKRLKIAHKLTDKPEELLRQPFCAVYNLDYEKAACIIAIHTRLSFVRTAEFCLAFAELYKFGYSAFFLGISVPIDLHKSAYWYLVAMAEGSHSAFIFLHRMAPGCFIEGIDAVTMINITEEALIEQARLVKPGESTEERIVREAVDDFIADMLIYPEGNTNLDDSIKRVTDLLKSIEKCVGPFTAIQKK